MTAISTVLGTLLALGLERTVRSRVLDSVLFLPAVVPDIVLAIGLLSFFTLAGVALGLHTVIAAHVVFDMIFVSAIVRTRLGVLRSVDRRGGARSRCEEGRDVLPGDAAPDRSRHPGGRARRLHALLRRVHHRVLHVGPTSVTFPIRVYSRIRFGLTPVINAIATLLLAVSFTTIFVAVRLNGQAARRALERAAS